MSEAQADVRRFLAAVAETPMLWRHFDMRVVAVRLGKRWVSIGASIRLTHEGPQPRSRLYMPDTTDLRILRQCGEVTSLQRILEQLLSGSLEVEGERVQFARAVDHSTLAPTGPYTTSYYQRGDLTSVGALEQPFPFGIRLTLSGDSVDQLINQYSGGFERLERQLRSEKRIWPNILAMGRYALDTPIQITHHTLVSVQVLAPYPIGVDLGKSSLKGGKATFALMLRRRDLTRSAELAYFGHPDPRAPNAGPVGRTLTLPSSRWRRAPGGWRGLLIGPAPHAVRVDASIRFGSVPIGDIDVRGKMLYHGSALSALYQQYDPGEEAVRDVLSRTFGKSVDFERAVAAALGLGGMAFVWLGHLADTQLPDVIGRIDDQLFIIECTTGPLRVDGKLPRLVARAGAAKRALNRARKEGRTKISLPAPTVTPVIVTSLSRQDLLEDETRAARKAGVVVLAQEDLLSLADESRSYPDATLRLLQQHAAIAQDEAIAAVGRMSRLFR